MREYLESNKVLCPVCGKEGFSPDDVFILCNHCGWEGAIDSEENNLELNGFTQRDYKKIYNEYLKNNPSFIWKNDKSAIDDYIDSFKDYGIKCPVCNEDSFNQNIRFCYRCGWRYSPVQTQFPNYSNSINKLSLNDYKNKYKKIIANNDNYLWKDTKEVNLPFSSKQKEWLRENNIKDFNKLTSDKELLSIVDTIEKIQFQYASDNTDLYNFINSILDIIFDII